VKLLKTDQIPDDVWSEIQKIREQIIAGDIKVEPTFEASAVRTLMTDVSADAK
jgi:simple sugar transport system substrate-binding protein